MAHLDRSEWVVETIPSHAEAVAMCRDWHYSAGAPNTSTYRHGMYRRSERPLGHPYGVALWIPPTRSAAEANAHGHEWTGSCRRR